MTVGTKNYRSKGVSRKISGGKGQRKKSSKNSTN